MRIAIPAQPARWTRVWRFGMVSALAIGGCGASQTPSQPGPQTSPGNGQSSASGTGAPVTTSTCPATAQLGGSDALPERQGAGNGATLWALFFPTDPSLTAGKEIKVVWRMTGSGDLSISATGPDGTVVKPIWGPEPHGGSTFERPGDEWGTGWVFPTAGCWTVNAKRTVGSGYLVLRVAG